MRRRVLVRLDATPDRVRAVATRALTLRDSPERLLVGDLAQSTGDANALLTVEIRAAEPMTPGEEPGSEVELVGTSDLRVPFFG